MNELAVGRFGSPFGVKGWIKVISYTQPIEQILNYLPWYIFKDNTKQVLKNVKGQLHGKNLIVWLPQSLDRDIAKTYTNLEIYIDKAQLPSLSGEEYYWVDLVGLSVTNQEAIELGTIESLFTTGSNDVMVVKDSTGTERYIPYIEDVVLKVDIKNKTMRVDWDAEF